MRLQNLVLATHNAGKLRELAALLAPLGVSVRSVGEWSAEEPEENGATFAENAAIKARAAARLTGLPSLSDDSGLAIPMLEGAPGIHSARWAGPGKDFTIAFDRILGELAKRRIDARTTTVDAYFICALCLHDPGGEEHVFEGRVDGALTFPARGEAGFGYDPIFIPAGHAVTFAEMPPAEKQAMSHRARAFEQLVDFLSAR